MSEDAGKGRHVVVVGAGIVGVACGLSLLRDGWRVTLIDREGPGEGTSFGNGSVITADSVLPVAMPGLWRKVPGMLLDPLGPLRIRWGYLPQLAPWLLRFVAASSPERVEAITAALGRLADGAVEAYQPLAKLAGAEDMIRRSGWLCVYESEADFEAAAYRRDLQKRNGVKFDVLRPEEIRQREPKLAPIFKRAVYYPDTAHTINNYRFVQVLADGLRRHGGQLLRERVTGFDLGAGANGGGVRAVLTEAGRHDCDAVVIAAGAWSRELCKQLGSDPPLDTERGYHLTVCEPDLRPRLPVYSTTRGIVCTPLEHGLRIAGTVELGGLEAPPDWRRAEVLMRHAQRWLPGLQDKGTTRWMGFRPSMPDSLPVISGSPRHANAYFAFGHGHCGLAYGARTGALLADLMAGRAPAIDLAPFRIDRF